MSDLFVEDIDGQLSFWEDNRVLDNLRDNYLVAFVRKEIKNFQTKLDFLNKYKNDLIAGKLNFEVKRDFEVFIETFFQMYDELTTEEFLAFLENFSSEFHKLCKLFLDYLQRYIYNNGIGYELENKRIKQIENLILMDPVSFRDIYYRTIKSKINDRSKLRVNNYLVFRGQDLVDKINNAINKEELKKFNNYLLGDIKDLVSEVAFNDIFVKGELDFLEEDQRGIFCVLLLYYLENFVYNRLEEDSLPQDVVTKLEMFIVYNFSNKFILSERQMAIYEKVKENVGTRLSEYIIIRSEEIKKHLRDFDEFEKFKVSGKIRIIEEKENLDFLPNIIDEENLKLELEYFLMDVFMLEGNFEKINLPIFQKELEIERHIAMQLALEYLKRFVYKNQGTNNKMIYILEYYVYQENNFVVRDSSLCLTKSILYNRVNRRNVAKSNKLR